MFLPRNPKLPAFWQLQIGGWTVYFVMIYVTFLTVAAENSFLYLLQIKAFRTLTGFVLTCGLREIYRRFAARLTIKQTIVFALVCAAVFGALWTIIENAFFWLINRDLNWASVWSKSPRVALDYAMTITAWSAIYFVVKYWQQWQTARENALQSEALAKQAQLDALRYQLNPHFLFNSLNSLRALIDEDARRAKQMTTQLAEFLRYSLVNNANETTLGEEIEAARNYLAIEKIRFENRLNVLFDVDAAANDFRLPPFLLNPLVENAVKHGFANNGAPLEITVSAKIVDKVLRLEVANNGVLNTNGNGAKIGLQNVCERLAKLAPAPGEFVLREENGFVRAQITLFAK